MTSAVWSWLAASVSIAGLWISGVSPRAGWVYGFGAQAVWFSYVFFTAQPGMIALSVAFVVLYMCNLHRWRGTRFIRVAAQEKARLSLYTKEAVQNEC